MFAFKVEKKRRGKTGVACRWCSAGFEGGGLWQWDLLANTG